LGHIAKHIGSGLVLGPIVALEGVEIDRILQAQTTLVGCLDPVGCLGLAAGFIVQLFLFR
jgi:hypothetical protein